MIRILFSLIIILSWLTFDSLSCWLIKWNKVEEQFDNQEHQEAINGSSRMYVAASLLYWIWIGFLFSVISSPIWLWLILIATIPIFLCLVLLSRRTAYIIVYLWTFGVSALWITNVNRGIIDLHHLLFTNSSNKLLGNYILVLFLLLFSSVIATIPSFIFSEVFNSFNNLDETETNIENTKSESILFKPMIIKALSKTILRLTIPVYFSLTLGILLTNFNKI